MRKIVQLKQVDQVLPIEGADAIEQVALGGWKVVTKKGEFAQGDTVLYFEVDSFLPEAVPAFAFLAARGRKEVSDPTKEGDEKVAGHVLRTAKLRGAISQGLVLPPAEVGLTSEATQDEVDEKMATLGVFKYEPSLPNTGAIIGTFLEGVQKTDSERVQNLTDGFLQSLDPQEWFATEKVDGMSTTIKRTETGIRIFSRAWEVSFDENTAYGRAVTQYNLPAIMPVGSVIQAETFGQGIQKNPLKINGIGLQVFSVSLPDGMEVSDFPEFAKFLADHKVPHYDMALPRTVDAAIEQVNGLKSIINPQVNAEGVVWWNKNGTRFPELGDRANFKAINNKYLLKHGG